MQRTLVLDQSYRPVNVVTWQRAVIKLMNDRAEVLEEYDTEIHGGMQMPAVIRLNRVVQRDKQRVKFSRANLLARDRGRCQYCGHKFPSDELTYDHVIPRSQGGKTVWENIVMACIQCNVTKANRTPAQAEMKLLSVPRRPNWVPLYHPKLRVTKVPVEWRDYWTVELEP